MAIELSILVATVPSQREGLLSRLLARLEPQLDDPRVEVIVHEHETKTMGRKFNELYQAASGRLSVQVDDDDLVSEDYVAQVLAVSEGHDFVGYKVDYTENGGPATTYEIDPLRALTLKPYDPQDYVRHITPKCPVLTSEARRHHFSSYFGADYTWTQKLVADGYPFNPVFIDAVLYYYDCWPEHSLGTDFSEWTDQRQVPVLGYDRERFAWID